MTEIALSNVEIPRDRYQRPLVIPPEHDGDSSAKRVSYRRVTTFTGALEDEFAFRQRDKRLVAWGISQRQDLHLAASALSLDDAHKRKLQSVADDAYEVAQGHGAATIGTALHGHTETLDRGIPLGFIPPPYDADLDAYQRATEGIQWLSVECFRVNDEFKVAGTADRVGIDRHGRKRIYDVKTGKTAVDYPHGMAAQLAMYSRCQPYDIENDRRAPIEDDLDQDTAVIIWLPAGQGHCELYELDIARGWTACQVAGAVWTWRSQKALIQPLRDNAATPSTLSSLIDAATDPAQLRILWSEAKKNGTLTPTLEAVLIRRAQQLADEVF